MAIKVLIKRQIKEECMKDASNMLMKARSVAMLQKGYISTETLSSVNDRCLVLLLSMWQSEADWENYKASAARQDNEKKFSEILDGETQYEVFNMGLGS